MSRWNAFCALCLYDGKGIDASATGAVDGARFWTGYRTRRTVDIALEPVAVGCAMAWLCAGLMLYRDVGCAGWALGVVVVLLGVLRYQVDTALSPLPHMLGIGVCGQRGVVSGRIVEEPERGDDRVRFCCGVGKDGDRQRDLSLGRAGAGDGEGAGISCRLRRPHPARNPGAFDYRAFLAQQDIYSTLYIGKAEQVVAIERLPGYWLDEQLVLPVRGAVREAIECNLAGRTLARIAIGGEAADSRRSA